MDSANDKQDSRRSFLRSAVRGLGVVGLGLFAGASVHKRRRLVREGKCLDTQGRTGCQACGVFNECGLPRALSVKKVMRG